MRGPAAAVVLLVPLLAGGCKCAWEGRNVWLATTASEGKTLEAKAGDQVIVELPVVPGSKAKWYVVEVDARVLERKGPAEEQPGRATVQIAFDARKTGVTDLVAYYATSRHASPEKTFRTTVWVR